MRTCLLLLGLLLVALTPGCGGGNPPPRLATGCDAPGRPCVRYLPGLDSDGAPLDRSSLLLTFTAPVLAGVKPDALAAVTAAVNLESGIEQLKLVPVLALRADPQDRRQVFVDLAGMLATGAAIDMPAGAIRTPGGKDLAPFTVTLTTGTTPLAVALAVVSWAPANPALFRAEGTVPPSGATDEPAVRAELEGRLRLRPGADATGVGRILARFDNDEVRQRIPDHRVRAGLLLLTGTSGEPAVDFILASANRRNVPFQPLQVKDLSMHGAFAAVFYQPFTGKLQMVIDDAMALETLDNIAVVLAHEALHSSLGGGSATEETLAMAASTRVYEELILFDPAIVATPTAFTRQLNLLLLALRNSGRFGYPGAGILPRPGIEDVLHGVSEQRARSFRDLLFKPDFYGDIPKSGATGSEVIEAYYAKFAGRNAEQGKMRFDGDTLKLFDAVMDQGLSPSQVLKLHAALGLRAVALGVAAR